MVEEEVGAVIPQQQQVQEALVVEALAKQVQAQQHQVLLIWVVAVEVLSIFHQLLVLAAQAS
jgi:hypothetical protein